MDFSPEMFPKKNSFLFLLNKESQKILEEIILSFLLNEREVFVVFTNPLIKSFIDSNPKVKGFLEKKLFLIDSFSRKKTPHEVSKELDELYSNKKPKTPFLTLIDSLSHFISNFSPNTLYYFLFYENFRIKQLNGTGIYSIEQSLHDPRVFSTIKSLVNGLIEIREKDEGLFFELNPLSIEVKRVLKKLG